MTTALKSEPAAQAVARHIEALILEGSLVPGDGLKPERDLAAELSVSRPTLREGLKLLVDKGLLRSGGPRRGLEVAPLGTSVTDPLLALLAAHHEVADDYLEFRAIVESAAAAHAAERANAVDRARIEACLARIDRAHRAEDPEEEAEADAELHLVIYETSHNIVLLQVMRALAGSLRQDVSQNRGRLFALPTIRETLLAQHRAVAEAILARDPGTARRAAQEHVDFIRLASREIAASQEQLELSLRRLRRGGVGVTE